MQLVAFGDFHLRSQYLPRQIFKPLAGITAIDQDIAHLGQLVVVEQEHQQGAVAIIDVGGCHCNRMRQALRIHSNVPFDARHLLAGVIPFVPRGVRVLDALRVHDAEARRGLPSVVLAFLRHLIFLMPAPAGFPLPRQVFESNGRSDSAPCWAKENHPAVRATLPHSSANIKSRRKCHTDPTCSAPSSSSILPAAGESVRIAPG